MPCRSLLPLALLALLTWRTLEQWHAGQLDVVSLLVLPVAAVLTAVVVRQPGCGGGACDVETSGEPETRADAVRTGRAQPSAPAPEGVAGPAATVAGGDGSPALERDP